MSLINDMLNDLDERRSQQQRQETSLDWMSGQKINRKKQWLLPLVITVSVLVLLVFGFGVWRFMQAADMAAVDKLAAVRLSAEKQSPEKQSPPKQAPAAPAKQATQTPAVLAATGSTIATANTATASPAEEQATDQGEQAGSATKSSTALAEAATETAAQQVTAAPAIANPAVSTSKIVPAAVQDRSKPNRAVADVKAADIKTDRPLSRAQQDIKQAKQAEMLIRDGRTATAEAELQQFLQKNPQAERSAELLASVWLSQQRYEEVDALLASLKTYNVRSVGLQKIEARLLMLTGRHQQAVDLLMAGHPAIELHADYYVLLGLAARQTQQYQLSAEAYSGLLAFDASQGDWWVGLAIALDLQEEYTAAREAYRRAVELRKISPALRSYAEQRLQ